MKLSQRMKELLFGVGIAAGITENKVKNRKEINSNELQISYIDVEPFLGKKGKEPFQIPVIDATLSEANRILAGRIIKASNGNRSKYF